ncbi:MAG: ATP-binding protein [Cytophagales bacterium]|nr:ATP-binding protein [Cytophagales bacterium]
MSSSDYHRVLKRQIRKTFGGEEISDPKVLKLLELVNRSYHDNDEDRKLLEHTMELNSQELIASNNDLRKQGDELKKAYFVLDSGQEKTQGSETLASLAIALKFKNKELNRQAIQLKKANKEIKDTQSKLIHTEKIAVLGQLIAGVMHEVNNPMGVIKGGTQNLEHVISEVIGGVKGFRDASFTSVHHDLFRDLIAVFQNKKFRYMTSREERQYRKEMEAYLLEIGMTDVRFLAREMVSVDLLKEDIVPIIDARTSIGIAKDIIGFAVGFGKLFANVSNMGIAIGKMQKILFALRNYTYSNDSKNPVHFDLIDNLETVLTLYHNKLKRGIQIERNYCGERVEILGFPDEINQVWTNLVQNAIHAMEGEGILKLEVCDETAGRVVRITDNGGGISKQGLKKIFEPFYTTKIKGEGTGLGLSICKKIVEKHGGLMEVSSKPGETTFCVTFPKEIAASEIKEEAVLT